MRKSWRKVVAAGMSILMSLSCLGTNGIVVQAAYAEEVSVQGDFVIEDGVLTKYTGEGGTVVIPNGITSIGAKVFEHFDTVQSVVIPDGVTSIGDYAFHGCSNLTSITIPDSVTNIGYGAFMQSGITNIKIPENIKVIDGYTFYGCNNLSSIIIPDGVTSIGNYAFYECCNLLDITIPENTKQIGENAFIGTKWLDNKRSQNPLVVVNDILIDARTCTGNVVIPQGVTYIGNNAFDKNNNVRSIEIPNTVIGIDIRAFAECSNLFDITIPNSVKYIGNGAFYGCTGLTKMVIPDSVERIGNSVYYGCRNLSHITIPNTLKDIGCYTFRETKWMENKIKENPLIVVNGILVDGLTAVGDVVVPEGVTEIGSCVFYSISGNNEVVTSITIPQSVTSIADDAFAHCSKLTHMKGYTGSYAEEYAKENGYAFVSYKDESEIQSPRIDYCAINESCRAVEYDIVEFGSYPQTEVTEGALTEEITSANYDDKGDAVVNGKKYRRVNESDACDVGGSVPAFVYKWDEGGDENGYHYFMYEPIRWRVLSVDGEQAILSSDISLDYKRYHEEKVDVDWENSTIRSWFNGYDSINNACEVDYTIDNFIDAAFSESEQESLVEYKIEDGDSVVNDKVFLLSEEEILNYNFGFVNDEKVEDVAKIKQLTEYAHAMGSAEIEGYYWLRAISSNIKGIAIDKTGKIIKDFIPIRAGMNCVPSIVLDLTADDYKVLYESYKTADKSELPQSEKSKYGISTPRILFDLNNSCGLETTYDIIEFGSYPKTELTNERLTDEIINASYDKNGDAWVDGSKYHRIAKLDITDQSSWKEEIEYRYFLYEPILWKVLSVEENQALVLAYEGLDCKQFHVVSGDAIWKDSAIRSWLNGYDSSSNIAQVDYSDDNFLDKAFTETEQNAVKTTALKNYSDKQNKSGTRYEIESTEDKVFLLAENNILNLEYGFSSTRMLVVSVICDLAKQILCTEYAKAKGVTVTENYCNWWIRTPGDYAEDASAAQYNGAYTSSIGIAVENKNTAVCPALYLDLDSTEYQLVGTYSTNEDAIRYTKSLEDADLTLDKESYTYDGKEKKPVVTVKYGSKVLTVGVDYTVSYSNNIDAGTATVTITGIGNYSGTVSKNFTIVEQNGIFQWNRDNWNFNNSSYEGYFSADKYINQINDSYVKKLKNNLTNSEYRAVFNTYSGWIYNRFGGSCYGMSSTSLLAKNQLLPYSNYKKDATNLYQLSYPIADFNVSSLVTYYQMLQVKSVIQQQYRTVPYKSHEDNIKKIIEELDENSVVLIGYQKDDWGGHAVLAYGYEYGSYTWDGVTYQGCIKICDPNSSKKENSKCNIYFNTKTYNWTIPFYSYAPLNSREGAKFNYIGANIDEINDGGYLTGTANVNSTSYVARMDAAEVSDNRSVSKVTKSNDGYVVNNSSSNDIIEDYSYVLGGESEGVAGYNLYDAESSYKLTQNETEELQVSVDYEKCFLEGGSAAGESVLFDKSGYVQVDSESADFNIAMTFDEDYPMDWFTIEVSGSNSNEVSLQKTEEGYILSGDNLEDVDINANNKEDEVTAKLTTEYTSAFIYQVDEDTIGVKVDADMNGTYETVLSDKDVHNYNSEWIVSEKGHCRACECGDISAVVPHVYKWVIDTENTDAETKVKYEECIVCGYQQNISGDNEDMGDEQNPAPSPEASAKPNETPSPMPGDTPSSTPEDKDNKNFIKGDVNGDNEVTLPDAQLTLKAALKITNLKEEQLKAADVDGKDGVTLSDAQLILKAALKIIQLE